MALAGELRLMKTLLAGVAAIHVIELGVGSRHFEGAVAT
jgi:hypothetical protein